MILTVLLIFLKPVNDIAWPMLLICLLVILFLAYLAYCWLATIIQRQFSERLHLQLVLLVYQQITMHVQLIPFFLKLLPRHLPLMDGVGCNDCFNLLLLAFDLFHFCLHDCLMLLFIAQDVVHPFIYRLFWALFDQVK